MGEEGSRSDDKGGVDGRSGSPLYFFPERRVSEEELRQLLADGTPEQRAEAISCLLRYAEWEDIWTYVTRDEVREIFASLDLPDNLRQAWARMLKIEASVT